MNKLAKQSGSLPEMKTAATEDIKVSEEKEREMMFLNRCQNIMSIVNGAVDETKLKKHPMVNSQYLPISHMEMMLDEYFFGLWGTENFRWQTVSNEIVASIDLVVFHPILKQWIRRTGAAAHQIMVDAIPTERKNAMTREERNEYATDIRNKKPAALAMGGFAALKAECFTNAVLSIGKSLGRDVNRDAKSGDYMPTIKDPHERKQELRLTISQILNDNQDDEEKQQIIDRILKAEEDGVNTIDFYRAIIKEIEK